MGVLTKEALAQYKDKLEQGILEYMRNPATPNAAQGIMAMVECLNMLKGAEDAICTGRSMTQADAEAWAARMVNEDGTTGAHWPMDQTSAVAESMGVSWDRGTPWCWWVAMNMMYSDYGAVAMRYGVSTAEFFAELAKAFLFDKDGPGPKEKLSAYYFGIVKAGK